MVAAMAAGAAFGASPLEIAVRGKAPAYTIVVPEKASPVEKYAAEELQGFLEKVAGVKLPVATDAAPLPPKAILVEGEQVVMVSEIERDEYWNIPALEEKLREIKKRYEQLHGGDGDFKGDINIQAHYGIPFSTIKRVLFSCNQAGFTNINFTATQSSAAGMVKRPGSKGGEN